MDIEEAIDALDAALAAEDLGQENPLTKEQAPVPDPEPKAEPKAEGEEAPEPITAKDVAGNKAEKPAAPDSTMLRDQLAALVSPAKKEPENNRDAELAQLRAAVQALATNKVADPIAFLQQHTGLTPEQLVEKQRQPDSLAQKAIEEARQLRQEQERLRQELAEKERTQQIEAIRAGLKSFVQSRPEEYVVTNKSGSHDLVLEMMNASLQEGTPLSETEAAAQVEGKLQEFINNHAPLLGWVKTEAASSQAPGKAETQPSTTINPQSAPATPTKSWEDMTDEEREREALRLLG